MAEYLVYLELFHLVLDLSLGGVDLPHVDADGEAVLLVDHDLGLHDQVARQQDVEEVRRAADFVHDVIRAVLLLAEVRVHLLDELGRPVPEQGDLLQVVVALGLLHVLDVEHLVVKVGLFEHEADCDLVCE